MIPGITASSRLPAVAAVSYVGTSDTRFIRDTTITETIPAATEAVDLLVASVMHRDVLTAPSGWSLLYYSGVLQDFNHQMSVYTRSAESGDAGSAVTFTQASSNRMSLNITTLRGGGYVSGSEQVGIDNGVIAMPDTVAVQGQIVLSVATSVYASTDDAGNTFFVSSGWEQVTPDFSTDRDDQIRLGVAYVVSTGATESGDWTWGDSDGVITSTRTDGSAAAYNMLIG